MLRGNKNKMLIITILCCLFVFMGVGYAIVSTQLNLVGEAKLSGVFNIKIVDMKVLSKTGLATEGEYSYNDLTATFSHNLYAPGDSIEYQITIENKGNIKASLNQITTKVTPEYDDLILTNSLNQGQVMQPGTYSNATATIEGGTKITFTVKSEFDIHATKLPDTKISPKYELEMIFHQHQGNNIVTPPNYSTDNVCFTIASDGTLKDYDYNCGFDVVVPMSVDGINVKKIDTTSFNTDDDSFITNNGFVKYETYDVQNIYNNMYENYFLSDNPEDLSIIKQRYGYTGNSEYDVSSGKHFLSGNLENYYMYTAYMQVAIDKDGNENYEHPEYILYFYYDPYEFYVVDNPEGFEAAKTYMENNSMDTSLLYVAGASAIEDTNYRMNLKVYFEEMGITSYSMYTDGYNDCEYTANLINSLDLSSAIYLETINTQHLFRNLNKLILPDGNLKTIGNFSFSGVGNLKKVTIPSTVVEIGYSAFSGMKTGSVINVNRPKSGMTLGASWSGRATVNYLE